MDKNQYAVALGKMAVGCSKTLTDDQRQALAKRLAGVRERRWKKSQARSKRNNLAMRKRHEAYRRQVDVADVAREIIGKAIRQNNVLTVSGGRKGPNA